MSWNEDAPKIDVYKWERRRAIKDHGICPFCKNIITVGQTYDRLFSVEDGKANVTKVHSQYALCRNNN